MSKPTDFLLGVLDFFAVLLPGALATWLVAQYAPPEIARYLDLGAAGDEPREPVRWAVFLLASYMLGHFVFMAGAKLDGSYDRWRRRAHPIETDLVYTAADNLRKELTPEITGAKFSTLKWSKSYIQIHCPAARIEIDRLEATSKFFRGLVVIAAVLAAHFLIRGSALPLAAASAIMGVLSFNRYCDQRWKSTELSYGTALILHATVQAGAKRSVRGTNDADED